MSSCKPESRLGLVFAVAGEEPLAEAVAFRVLHEGGNAVDAAVAMGFALAVTIPHLGGVGGDFFALVREPDGRVWFVNGSGHAPRRLTREMLESRGYTSVPSRGPLSPTVPGLVGGLRLLWEKGGTMEWGRLLEPARRLAREGFPASPGYVRSLQAYKGLLEGDPGSRETYLRGAPKRPGDPVRFPGLARLLELVADDPWSFYRGEPARAVEEYLSSLGGVLTAGDLGEYSPETGRPLMLEYRGWRLWEMPPNTQGLTTLHIMGVLEQWRLPRSVEDRFYYILSAAAPAYRARDRHLGDPRWMRHSPEELLSEEWLEGLRAEARSGPPSCLHMGRAGAGSGDTTFYAVADGEGRVVAAIQSLFMPFGSTVTEPRFQVTLHGRANGFTLEPGLPNALEPGKRPLHTLSAVIAESPDGGVYAVGTSGGHYRPQQHALLLTSIIDHGAEPGEAVALPRILWTPGTCSLVADPDAPRPPLPGYEMRSGRTGVASIVWVRERLRGSAVDPRGDGVPLVGAP